jgi:hypothetical protein
MPAKRRHGRPVGSKNKVKTSTTQINEPLDVSVAHPNPPQPSARALFSFSRLLVLNIMSNSVSL